MITIRIKADAIKDEITAIQNCIIRALEKEGFEVEKGEAFVKVANVVVKERNKEAPKVETIFENFNRTMLGNDKFENPLKEVAEQIWPSKKD